MKRSILVLILVGLTALASRAEAQYGVYADAGFGASIGGTSAEHTDMFVTAGAVGNSLIEAGLRVVFESELTDAIDRKGAGPYAAVYPVRQGEDLPVSVSLTGSYIPLSYVHAYPTDVPPPEGDESGYLFSVRTGIFRSVQLSNVASVIPSAEIGFVRSNTEPEGSERYETHVPTLTLSLPLLIDAFNMSSVVITPTTTVGEGKFTYGAFVSLVVTPVKVE